MIDIDIFTLDRTKVSLILTDVGIVLFPLGFEREAFFSEPIRSSRSWELPKGHTYRWIDGIFLVVIFSGKTDVSCSTKNNI